MRFVLGEDIVCCGELEYYDKSYDRVNVKNEKPLQSVNRIFHTVSISLIYLKVFYANIILILFR